MQILSTKNLSKKYKDFFAIKNVSIDVNSGDIYGLIGKNGAGKTTLFKLIMGLSNISSGEILIDNTNNLNVARRKIGFMIGFSFFPYLNAYQNIEYFRKAKGIKDKQETERVLKLVGLHGVNKPFKTFSMGMKQRLGIANALLGNPPIVILDEPINGLDPQGIIDIRKMIKETNKEFGTTFIISSHILSELDLIATKFGFIDGGVLLQEVSHEKLHRKTQKSLIVEVDDASKAVELLGTTNYSIGSNNEIVLDDFLDEPNKVAKILVQNGLELYTLKKQEATLEKYFMDMVGGGNDA